jgi:hypothetical protein
VVVSQARAGGRTRCPTASARRCRRRPSESWPGSVVPPARVCSWQFAGRTDCDL